MPLSEPTDLNLVILTGRLSSDPRSRARPSGDVVWSYEVTTRHVDGTTATVPVVLGDARPISGAVAGDEVAVLGRVRRRFFRAGGATASRTEVVAERLANGRRRRSVEALVDQAASRLPAPSG